MKFTDKYTARHEIDVPAGNGQAGKAPDSRMKYPSLSFPEREAQFLSLQKKSIL